MLAALLWGLQFAFLSPVLAMVLVSLFHASPAQLAWVLAVYNASGFAWALVIPVWADRHGRYLRVMAGCGALTLTLMIVLSVGHSVVFAAVALAVIGAPAGVGMSMLFAQMQSVGSGPKDVMNVRAVVSFAWVAGPPIATFIMKAFGDRAVLWTIAGVGVLGVVTVLIWSRRAQGGPVERSHHAHSDQVVPVGRVVVGILCVAFVLIQSTNSAVVSTMTLFVTTHLHLSVTWAGVVLAVAAGLEVPSLLVLGRLTQHISSLQLLLTGCLAGLVYYAGVLLVTGPILLIALQILNAWFVATMSGVGLTVFQQIIPRPGLAAGMYTNTRKVGSIVAGSLIGIAAEPHLGYAAIYAASAVITLVGMLAIAGIWVWTRRTGGSTQKSEARPG